MHSVVPQLMHTLTSLSPLCALGCVQTSFLDDSVTCVRLCIPISSSSCLDRMFRKDAV